EGGRGRIQSVPDDARVWRTEGLRPRTPHQQIFDGAPAHGDLGRNLVADGTAVVFPAHRDLCFHVLDEGQRQLQEQRIGVLVQIVGAGTGGAAEVVIDPAPLGYHAVLVGDDGILIACTQ